MLFFGVFELDDLGPPNVGFGIGSNRLSGEAFKFERSFTNLLRSLSRSSSCALTNVLYVSPFDVENFLITKNVLFGFSVLTTLRFFWTNSLKFTFMIFSS